VGSSYSSGAAKGPSPVRYLKAWPRVNILERYTRFSIGNIIMGAAGLLLLVLAWKPQKANKRRKSSAKKLAAAG
jgi:hypothetical protein